MPDNCDRALDRGRGGEDGGHTGVDKWTMRLTAVERFTASLLSTEPIIGQIGLTWRLRSTMHVGLRIQHADE